MENSLSFEEIEKIILVEGNDLNLGKEIRKRYWEQREKNDE
jgi:hypothetical protein